MNSVDNTERILRDMHHVIARSDPYPRDTSRVIIRKQEMLNLLKELTASIEEMKEDFELTKESRNRADLEAKRRNDEALAETRRRSEDVYAASMLYTHDALDRLLTVMHKANEDVSRIYEEMEKKMLQQEHEVRSNQMELKAQLQDMKDTEKYMGLVEERNREIEKEKNQEKTRERIRMRERNKLEASHYGDRQGEVKVNKDVLASLGMKAEDEPVVEEKKEAPVVRVNEQFIPNRKPELTPKKKEEKPAEKEKLVLADSVKEILKPQGDVVNADESAAKKESEAPKKEEPAALPIPEKDLKAPEKRREAVIRRVQQKSYAAPAAAEGSEEKKQEVAKAISAEMMGFDKKSSEQQQVAEDLQKVDLDAEYFQWQKEQGAGEASADASEEGKEEPAKKFGGLFKRKK